MLIRKMLLFAEKQLCRLSHDKWQEHFLIKEILIELQERISLSDRKFDKILYYYDESHFTDYDYNYDLIIYPLGLHTLNNPKEKLIKLKSLLKPGGLLLGAIFGGNNLSNLRNLLIDIESRMSDSVRQRIPPNIHVKDMGALLQHAGFTFPVTDFQEYLVEYHDLKLFHQDLKEMNEKSALKIIYPMSKKLYYQLRDKFHSGFIVNYGVVYFTSIRSSKEKDYEEI